MEEKKIEKSVKSEKLGKSTTLDARESEKVNSYSSSANIEPNISNSNRSKSLKKYNTKFKKKTFSSSTHRESFKSEDALDEEYKIILNTIREVGNDVDITTYVHNRDMEYYLKNNSMDYNLYKATIKHRKFTQMK